MKKLPTIAFVSALATGCATTTTPEKQPSIKSVPETAALRVSPNLVTAEVQNVLNSLKEKPTPAVSAKIARTYDYQNPAGKPCTPKFYHQEEENAGFIINVTPVNTTPECTSSLDKITAGK